MHDIKYIRENPDEFDAAMKKRGLNPIAQTILSADNDRRSIIALLESEQEIANAESKQAGIAKAAGHQKSFEELRDSVTKRKETIASHRKVDKESNDKFQDALNEIPNIPMDGVPIGKDEEDNEEFHRWGNIRNFEFTPQEHFNIPSVRYGMDFETAAKVSGSRFVFLSGAVARVHRALAQFMLDLHIDKHDLTEINPPVIVNSATMHGTGQLAKFSNDAYKLYKAETSTDSSNDQWLIPTSEVPLTNIVSGKILNKNQLPLRYCAHSLCFRHEAGSAGRDTAGMIRMHQFEKVEMVSITTPEDSYEELYRMTICAEAVLEHLGLAYRSVVLCTGDMGFSAQRTHDIEVWLPGQNRYREISSVSVCGDFQARRMNARFREKDGDKPQFVHTLNGSGVAVGRCLIAVLENGQQKDGSVKLPKALHPYLGGKDTINPDGILEKAT